MRCVLVVAFVVSLFFYDPLFDFVSAPYNEAVATLKNQVNSELVANGIGGGLLLQLKLCGVAAIVISAPVLALPDLGVHPARACTRSERQVDPGLRRASPARSSSSGSRSATTSSPRASRS